MADGNDNQTNGDQVEDFAALFAESEAKTSRRKQMSVGDVVRGRVIAVSAGGAFVEIGGKGEAVIDVGEFRDAETGAIEIAVGDEVEATVVDDGRTSGTVVLKRTVGRGGRLPGELEQALAHGIAVEGVVTSEVKGGFEVQIAGVRAFCPGSQIDRRRSDPAAYVGQRLRFRVSKIENGGRNVVVSRRSLLEEEAAEEATRTWERIHVGAVLEGKVISVRDFGAFVDLGGVEGLVHVSELGHTRVSHPSEVLQPDQTIEVKVIKVETAAEGGRARIGLSLRALAPDPWSTARERFPVGATVPGVVRRLENFGAFVEIAPGIDGLVHVSKLVLDRRISHPRQVVNIGDAVQVTVLAVDEGQRRISLSMIEQARRERDTQEISAKVDEESALGRVNERRNLGTLAELLAASKRKPEGGAAEARLADRRSGRGTMLASLDHIVLAVADLDAATAAYERLLGRSPSWCGSHPAFGTRNTLFRLSNTYLELLAASPSGGPLADRVRATLAEREERPFALALGVSDVEVAVRTARRRGLVVADAAEGTGSDDASGRRRSWRSAFIDSGSTRGLQLFVIQHLSPAAALPPAPPRGDREGLCDAVDHVVVFTQDLDASLGLWSERFSLEVAWRRDFPERGTRNLGLDLGGIVVELIQRSDRPASDKPDTLWGVAYGVADCGPAAARLRDEGIEVDEPRPGLAAGTRVASVRWKRTPTLLIDRHA